jgi:hypothetical protein
VIGDLRFAIFLNQVEGSVLMCESLDEELTSDNYIEPSVKSRKNLLSRLSGLFYDSIRMVGTPVEAKHKKKTYADTLISAGNIVRGWGNTCSFCTDDRLMDAVDLQMDEP